MDENLSVTSLTLGSELLAPHPVKLPAHSRTAAVTITPRTFFRIAYRLYPSLDTQTGIADFLSYPDYQPPLLALSHGYDQKPVFKSFFMPCVASQQQTRPV
ncbi:hypothetical protein [Bifidobacterium sp. ESL0704]|uniref:hypothetical protein n=1 Tax=Bifidobacterium sp. ESL0704 TaxID=2983219 RepID=UPI0023F7E66E|nr:hypothetical protein [Bifidobacterium sp. ESL0704]WEV53644.1 hypothetical protein OZX64_04090 [Bifidobacterium sp. ESL0704]